MLPDLRRVAKSGSGDLASILNGYHFGVADPAAFEIDSVVVPIGEEPTMTLDEWLALVDLGEPVDLGVSAADLLAEAREAGEA